jgi:phosphatidylinositol-3-phosphatase
VNARRKPRLRSAPTRRSVVLATALTLIVTSALAAGGITVAANAGSHKHHVHAGAHKHHVRKAHPTAVPASPTRATPSKVTRRVTTKNQICGTRPSGSVHIKHVIWIVMENRSYNEVVPAPYIASLAASCGLATNYHNISHPSLPNYIAMTSGRSGSQLPPTDCPHFCPVAGPSIFSQVASWGVYAESMPGSCVRHDARPYVVHHTAAPYYTALSDCARRDLPLTALNLAALPAFSLLVPNVNNDMHETSSSVSAGDRWLRAHLGAILNSAVYRSGSTVVFLTWDEGGIGGRTTNNCATNTTDPGCHVALLVMSPFTQPGTRWTGLANHYSLLRMTEQILGLPLLGRAASAPSLKRGFRL